MAEGRYVASKIPGAQFVELPGEDHLPFVGDQDSILDEVEQFLTGTRHAQRHKPVLATVLSASFKLLPDQHKTRSGVWRRLQDHITREVEWFRGRARAIRCAAAIAHHASRLRIQITAGLHTGECEVAGNTVCGPARDTARKIEQAAGSGRIVVSAAVRDLVSGSGISFLPEGTLEVGNSAELLLLLVDAESKVTTPDEFCHPA